MPTHKPANRGISSNFKTDAIIRVATPIILIIIAIVATLIAPKILQSREIDRCREIKGSFDYEKHECVVVNKESR